MKSFLINVIESYLASPQGPARLYGYARRAGMDVTFLNLNHDAYSYLLSGRTLRELLDEARPGLLAALARDRYLRRDFGSILIESSGGQVVKLLAAVLGESLTAERAWGKLPLAERSVRALARLKLNREKLPLALLAHLEEVTRRIGAAQEEMDRRFLRQPMEQFLALFRVLLCGKAIIDALHYPALLDFGFGFWGTEWDLSAPEIVRATRDERHNYLLPYYRQEVMPQLRAAGPRLIGLSATHSSELLPAFSLARMIKDELPETHVVLGGAAVADVRDRIARNACLWDLIDSLVYGPGEIAFTELADALEGGRPLARVPNLVYRGDDGEVCYSERVAEVEPDEMATPEYVGLRPGAGVALETSSSCYWGRCAFCYYPRQGTSCREYRNMPVKQRSLEKVFGDMQTLRERHDPSFIGFTDSALSPSRLERIAEFNVESGLRTPFSAFIRLEDEFASPEFCRKLADGGFLGGQAGLESANEHVNARMNKGIKLALAPTTFRSFRQSGLLLHLYTLVGFPGETVEESWNTYRFLKRHHSDITLDWQVYSLWVLENGPLAEHADAYGLKVERLPDELLIPLCTYEAADGMGQADSVKYSLLFEEKLRSLRHPLSRWFDVESYKLLLFWQRAAEYRARNDERAAPSRRRGNSPDRRAEDAEPPPAPTRGEASQGVR